MAAASSSGRPMSCPRTKARRWRGITTSCRYRSITASTSLGFLDVSEIGGSAYADSVNVGMTDLVAALRWVHENIANFGGDPDKVMIYGQSGGGSKVTTLMGMPSARGCSIAPRCSRAAAAITRAASNPKSCARQIMKELGLGPKDIGALQKMDWAKLTEASNAATAKMNPPAAAADRARGDPVRRASVGARPWTAASSTCDPSQTPPRRSRRMCPMLIGSVSEEGNRMLSRPTEAEWHATLAKTYGDAKATALIAAMKKAHPEKSIRTLSYGVDGMNSRNNVARMAKLKYDLKAAPVFAYYFTWQSPMLEDAGAWHTAELAFCFDNTKRCEQGTGNTPEAQALAKKMATAWANFARTGNPSQPGLTWAPFEPDRCPTMVFDNQVPHGERSRRRGAQDSAELRRTEYHLLTRAARRAIAGPQP